MSSDDSDYKYMYAGNFGGGRRGISPALRVLLILIFTLCALFGAGMLSFSLLAPAVHSLRMVGWVETPCLILGSRITEEECPEGRTLYTLDIVYQYQFEGVRFVSRNYQSINRRMRDYRPLEQIIARYPPGSERTCHVNPNSPDESALDRRLPSGLERFWFLSIAMLIIGVGGLIWAACSGGKGASEEDEREHPWLPPAPSLEKRSMPEAEDGYLLQSAITPWRRFFSALIMFLAWNGLTVFIILILITREREGHDLILPILLLVPLSIIGLLHAGMLVFSIAKLRTPRVQLIVNRIESMPGDDLRINWQTQGDADRVDKLRIVLEGREEAISPVGVPLEGDPFEVRDVATVENRLDILSGGASFRIPKDAMHSFETRHNRLIWRLKTFCASRGSEAEEVREIIILPPEIPRSGE